ncbi:MAG: hypothetical protein K2J83_06355, partial [Clostridia bacterium]|nr:hypothetical protein [Clostridia bacterium]
MKFFKKSVLVFIVAILTIGVVLFSACSLKTVKLSKIPRDGNYRFISQNYITSDGSALYLPTAINKAVRRYLRNTKINTTTHYLVPDEDGVYIAVKFYYGDDKTRYDLAFGYMKYATLRISVGAVIKNADRLAYASKFDGQKFIFKSADGEYKIFDYKIKAVEPFSHPEEMAENNFIGFSVYNDKLGASYYDEEEGDYYFYSYVNGYGEKIITYHYDEAVYKYDYKENYLYLTTDGKEGIVAAFDPESGEIISGESAYEMYTADEGKAVLDGKEYAYDFEKNTGLLTISDGENGQTFTMEYLRETVPEINEAYAIYESGTLSMHSVIIQNGEFYLVLKCGLSMFGYLGMTPPLILRFNPDSCSFSYIGFHPDHTYSIR